jgi:glycosyltransferase EpsE
MPKVSVIMGVYNGSKVIKNAIESILNQSFTDFEIIVCDDGSSDNSAKIVEEISREDNRVTLLKNPQNMKLSTTLNNCLEVAKGIYIARMDDDDIAHPERLEKQVEFLDHHPEYAVVGTSRNMFDNKGIWGREIFEGELTKLNIFTGPTLAHPSVMMRKESIMSVHGYSVGPEFERTEDFDLWCKILEKGYRIFNLGVILLDYYEARDSYSKRKFKYRIINYRLKKNWRKRLGISAKYLLYVYKPVLVGVLPKSILIKYHNFKFKENN